MNPLPELFLAPCVGPSHWADIARPATHQFAGAVIVYGGAPARVEFVQAELAAAGVPGPQARAFLASSEPVGGAALGLLGDLKAAVNRLWDPEKHPKDDHGRWSSAGGPSAPPGHADRPLANDPHTTAAVAMIDAALKRDPIGAARGTEYRAAALSVVAAMSPGAVERLTRNVKVVHFVATFPAVATAVRRRLAQLGDTTDVPDGVCGAYIKDDRAVVTDGGVPGTRPEEGVHAAGVFAHEVGHALDGPDDEISRSDAWLAAWTAEIKSAPRPPSDYAQKAPAEGFAEFHRALVANRAAAVRLYPKCAAVWKAHGIL